MTIQEIGNLDKCIIYAVVALFPGLSLHMEHSIICIDWCLSTFVTVFTKKIFSCHVLYLYILCCALLQVIHLYKEYIEGGPGPNPVGHPYLYTPYQSSWLQW